MIFCDQHVLCLLRHFFPFDLIIINNEIQRLFRNLHFFLLILYLQLFCGHIMYLLFAYYLSCKSDFFLQNISYLD